MPQTPLHDNAGMRMAVEAVRNATRTGMMAAIYGESGTGKTAAAFRACDTVGGAWVYVQAPYRCTSKDVVAACHAAVFGQPPRSTRQHASMQLVHALADQRVGLCIDEVHYTGVAGIQSIRYIHDQIAAIYNVRIPIVLIGVTLDRALLESGGEMDRRCPWRAKFTKLTFPEVKEMLPTMNPRLGATDSRILQEIFSRYAHGLPGRWANVASATDNLNGTGPISPQDASDVLLSLGVKVGGRS